MSNTAADTVCRTLDRAIVTNDFWNEQFTQLKAKRAEQFASLFPLLARNHRPRQVSVWASISLKVGQVDIFSLTPSATTSLNHSSPAEQLNALDYITSGLGYDPRTHKLYLDLDDDSGITNVMEEKVLTYSWVNYMRKRFTHYSPAQLYAVFGEHSGLPATAPSNNVKAKYLVRQLESTEFILRFGDKFHAQQAKIIDLWNEINFLPSVRYNDLGLTAVQRGQPLYTATYQLPETMFLAPHSSQYRPTKVAALTDGPKNSVISEYSILSFLLNNMNAHDKKSWYFRGYTIKPDHPYFDIYGELIEAQAELFRLHVEYTKKVCTPEFVNAKTRWDDCPAVQQKYHTLKEFAQTGGLEVPDFVFNSITRNALTK